MKSDYSGKGFKKKLYEKLYDFEDSVFLKRENSSRPKMQSGMFMKREVFNKLKGFKEGLFGEDSDFAERTIKKGYKFGILKKCGRLKNSVRRYENKGVLKMILKYAYLNSKAEIFGYKSLKEVSILILIIKRLG